MAKRGRPSKYKPEYCQQIIKFFSIKPYKDVEIPHYDKKGEGIVVWTDFKRVPNDIPFFQDFAWKIGVDDETLANWCKKYPEFLGAYTRCKHLQKRFLIINGTQGLYPPKSYTFTAINITDMKDKSEQEWGDKTRQTIADIAAQMAGENGNGTA